jgi:hypothetical protein
LVAFVGAGGLSGQRLELGSGSAWLWSSEFGAATLVDGSSEQRAAYVLFDVQGDATSSSVMQSGHDAYVVDSSEGTVTRLDGATYETALPADLGTAGGRFALALSDSSMFSVDGSRAQVTRIDPLTLAPIGAPLAVPARAGADQAVVDNSGRLWVIDASDRGVTWISSTGDSGVVPEGDSKSRLVLVEGKPLLVDVTRSRVGKLEVGGIASWSCVAATEGQLAGAQWLGSATSPYVYAALPNSSTLLVSNVGSDGCETSVLLGDRGHRFGRMVEAHGYVLVPDQTTGTVFVVSVADAVLADSLEVGDEEQALELVSRDDLVFYNEVASAKAGVIRFGPGGWDVGEPIQKYNPDDPTEGEHTTPASSAATTETTDAPTTSAADGVPVITGISMNPDPPVAGETVTFTAAATNTAGASWDWTMSFENGDRVDGSSPDTWSVRNPASPGLEGTISLILTNESGSSHPFNQHFENFFEPSFTVTVTGGGTVDITVDGGSGTSCTPTAACLDLPLFGDGGPHHYTLVPDPDPGWVLKTWNEMGCLGADGIDPKPICEIEESPDCRCRWEMNVMFVKASQLTLSIVLPGEEVHVTGPGIDCPGDCTETKPGVRWDVVLHADSRSTWNFCGPRPDGLSCELTLTSDAPEATVSVTPDTFVLTVRYDSGGDFGTEIDSTPSGIRCGNVVVGETCSHSFVPGTQVNLHRGGAVGGGVNVELNGAQCDHQINQCDIVMGPQDLVITATVLDPPVGRSRMRNVAAASLAMNTLVPDVLLPSSATHRDPRLWWCCGV